MWSTTTTPDLFPPDFKVGWNTTCGSRCAGPVQHVFVPIPKCHCSASCSFSQSFRSESPSASSVPPETMLTFSSSSVCLGAVLSNLDGMTNDLFVFEDVYHPSPASHSNKVQLCKWLENPVWNEFRVTSKVTSPRCWDVVGVHHAVVEISASVAESTKKGQLKMHSSWSRKGQVAERKEKPQKGSGM